MRRWLIISVILVALTGCNPDPPLEDSSQHYVLTHTCQWGGDIPGDAYFNGTEVTTSSFSVYVCTGTGEDVHVFVNYVKGKPWHP